MQFCKNTIYYFKNKTFALKQNLNALMTYENTTGCRT